MKKKCFTVIHTYVIYYIKPKYYICDHCRVQIFLEVAPRRVLPYSPPSPLTHTLDFNAYVFVGLLCTIIKNKISSMKELSYKARGPVAEDQLQFYLQKLLVLNINFTAYK